MTSKILWIIALAPLVACGSPYAARRAASSVSVLPAPPVPADWRTIANSRDKAAIDALPARWAAALGAVAAWRKRAVAAEGALLTPTAALVRPLPPPGRYRCRTLRLAPHRQGGFEAFQPWFCFIAEDGELTTLTKATGSDRPAGRLWPDGERRLVFLGATPRGPARSPPAYGDNRLTDEIGVFERTGDFQWRLVLLRGDAGLDVIEFVPDVPQPAPRPAPS